MDDIGRSQPGLGFGNVRCWSGVCTCKLHSGPATGSPGSVSAGDRIAGSALLGLWFQRSRGLAGFALGLVLTAGAIGHELGLRVKESTDSILVTGRVCSLPVAREGVVRFMFCLAGESLNDTRYQISWYRPVVDVIPGQRWLFAVKLGQPTGSVNFGLFDYERWQFVKRIHGRGYVRQDVAPILIGMDSELVNRLRYHIREKLRPRVPDTELGTYLALTLGDTSLLDPGQWTTLNGTGTTHLLIVSGLHAGLIAVLVFNLLGLAGVRLSRAISVTIIATGCYALIAGWGLPVQRAFIMTTTVLLCISAARQIKPGIQVLAALVAVIIFDPLASLSSGFWLSFGAVLALLYGLHGRFEMSGSVGDWFVSTLKAQWIVYIALMPGLAYIMGQLPLGSLLINLVAIPWVGFLLVPALFLGLFLIFTLPPAGALILQVVSWQVSLLWRLLESAAGWVPVYSVPEHDLLVVLWAAVGVVILLSPKGLLPRWPALLCLALLLRPTVRSDPDAMKLTFFDVGQGLSVLIETNSSTVLYDTGPAYGERFSAVKQIVLPALQRKRRRHLDRVIISHSDNDHAGGLNDLQEAFRIRRILNHQHCDDEWMVDGVRFATFSANTSDFAANNASCLMFISFMHHRVLLTGDIEEAGEYAILDRELGRLTLMSSPHHGSDSSSTPAFLNRQHPEVIVVSAGYQNRFGHPHSIVLERYNNRAIRMLNTAAEGAVEFKFTPTGYSILSARREQPALWRR